MAAPSVLPLPFHELLVQLSDLRRQLGEAHARDVSALEDEVRQLRADAEQGDDQSVPLPPRASWIPVPASSTFTGSTAAARAASQGLPAPSRPFTAPEPSSLGRLPNAIEDFEEAPAGEEEDSGDGAAPVEPDRRGPLAYGSECMTVEDSVIEPPPGSPAAAVASQRCLMHRTESESLRLRAMSDSVPGGDSPPDSLATVSLLREAAGSKEVLVHPESPCFSSACRPEALVHPEPEHASAPAAGVPSSNGFSRRTSPADRMVRISSATTFAPSEDSAARPRASTGPVFPSRGQTGSITNKFGSINFKSAVRAAQAQIEVQKAGNFTVRGAWDLSDLEMLRIQNKSKAKIRSSTYVSDETRHLKGHLRTRQSFYITQKRERCSDFIISPQSKRRLGWDLTAGCLLFFDMVYIPLAVFSIPRSAFFSFMDWTSVIYWTFDMGMSFGTGYYEGTDIEWRPSKIARNYARTWLGFDILMVLPEWCMLIIDSMAVFANSASLARTLRTARFVRFLRYLRMLRLLRLVKVKQLLEDFKERTNHEAVLVAASLAKVCIIIGLMCHFLACCWYGVGDNEPHGWIYDRGIHNQTIGEKYMYSFQFALSRLHPSVMSENMELHSQNEKLFSIFATMNALLVSSVFVSHITNKMAEVKRLRDASTSKLMLIRQYVHKHDIAVPLGMQLKKYITTGYAAKLRGNDEAELMNILPPNLLAELRHQTWSPILARHRVFELLHVQHTRTECDLCLRAVKEVTVFPEEVVFCSGDACGRMLFVESGRLNYQPSLRSEGGGDREGSTVQPGIWLSEACLWTAWEHCGDLNAEIAGCLVAVNAEEFSTVIREHENSMATIVQFARDFLRGLNASSVLSDLPVDDPAQGSAKRLSFTH